MELGAFSISLSVKDLAASRAFYEKLGFQASGGAPEQGWLILRNGHRVIGLFQGMFEKNMLTFNPGWDQHCAPVEPFTDVRQIAAQLLEGGLEPAAGNVADSAAGPAYILVVDPDGNPVLIDQHR